MFTRRRVAGRLPQTCPALARTTQFWKLTAMAVTQQAKGRALGPAGAIVRAWLSVVLLATPSWALGPVSEWWTGSGSSASPQEGAEPPRPGPDWAVPRPEQQPEPQPTSPIGLGPNTNSPETPLHRAASPQETIIGSGDLSPPSQPTITSPLPRNPIGPGDSAGALFPSAAPPEPDEPWTWQLLPSGLVYRSYLAGMREPRLAGMWVHDWDLGWVVDMALGARVGLFRCGTTNALRPEGWQLDFEAAAFPRIDIENDLEMVATDYRYGIPLTFGIGHFQTKFGFYHVSSHLADEFLLRHPGYPRINYVRDGLLWGVSYYVGRDLRLYAEAGWSFNIDGGAEPWEFQFGIDYSPAEPVQSLRGTPFVAINGHLRQEVDFGGHLVVQTGWQWRGSTGNLLRLGMQYFHGKSEQFEFYRQDEDRLGLGLWYDF